MKSVFARLGADFFSTIVFLAIYLTTDNVLLATGVAIAGAIAQVIYSRVRGSELGYMTWASLALVIVLIALYPFVLGVVRFYLPQERARIGAFGRRFMLGRV